MPYERIDPHVHFRGGIESHKETIAHGMKLAHAQGVTKVINIPNLPKPYTVIDEPSVEEHLLQVPQEERKNYFLYVCITHDREQVARAVWCYRNIPEVAGMKSFAGPSTGDLGIIEPSHQRDVYEWAVDMGYDGPWAVHCEENSLLMRGADGKQFFDPRDPMSHCRARPKEAEIASAEKQISYAIDTGFRGTLHIVHASVPETVGLVRDAKRNRDARCRFTCGATPHHLMYTEHMMIQMDWYQWKMNPPLRASNDVVGLRQCVQNGEVDWIESDHAPHGIGEKMYGNENCPSGHPSLYIYSKCVDDVLPNLLKLTPEQIKALTSDNILKVFEKLQ